MSDIKIRVERNRPKVEYYDLTSSSLRAVNAF